MCYPIKMNYRLFRGRGYDLFSFLYPLDQYIAKIDDYDNNDDDESDKDNSNKIRAVKRI